MSENAFDLDDSTPDTTPCVVHYWPKTPKAAPTPEQIASGECNEMVFHLRPLTLGDEEKIVSAADRNGSKKGGSGAAIVEKLVRATVSVSGLRFRGQNITVLSREAAAKLPSWVAAKVFDAIAELNERPEGAEGN